MLNNLFFKNIKSLEGKNYKSKCEFFYESLDEEEKSRVEKLSNF
jgi:hypothetical protein